MTNHAVLIREIETLPHACVDEVADFVAWIKYRKLSQTPETMLLSQAVLAKDEAWAGL